MKKIINLTILSVLVLIASGCAMGTRKVSLAYPPVSEDENAAAKLLSAGSPVNGKKVTIVKFSDTRDDRLVGRVENGYGMKIAKIISNDDVAEWVTRSIAFELKRSGYEVTQVYKRDKAPADAYFIISGTVLQIYTTATMTYEGTVSYYVTVEKDGKKIIEKPYVGNITTGVNWAARGKSYSSALSQALLAANNNLLVDLLGLEEQLKKETNKPGEVS